MIKNDKKVSLCIAAYNAEMFIEKCIDSAINQTYKNIQIIIINDDSIDNTDKLINSYLAIHDNIIYKKNEKNIGYLKTFNKLLKLCDGDLICFLDSDDWISENKIESQVKFLEENLDVGLVGTFAQRCDMKGGFLEVETYPLENNKLFSYAFDNREVGFCGSSVMLRSEIYGKIGGYNPYFDNCPGEDLDWILRIMSITKVANIPEVYYFYRFNTKSLTRKVHYDYKARYVSEIIFFMNDYRLKHGEELDVNNSIEFKNFIDNIKSNDNKGNLYYSTSIQHCINSDYYYMIRDLRLSLFHNGFKLISVKNLLLIITIYILPISFLLRLKSIFKLKNISTS